MIKLGIDAGHGLNTAGKQTPAGEKEWGFNNTVLLAFVAELNKYNGIQIKRFDDPTGKTDVSLKARTDGANAWKADYYISFHHNANTSKWGNWTGTETFIYTNPNPKSVALANAINPALVKGYGLKDRGIKKQNLHIVRETKMPAILVEGGFMDSNIDIRILRDTAKLKNAGSLMAQAFAKHVGLKLKVVAPPVVEKPKTDHLKVSADALKAVSEEQLKKGFIKEIKAAVADGRFSSKHEDVEKYDKQTLTNYAMVALARKK